MLPESFNRKEFGRYLAMSQAGLEMVVPAIIGLLVDRHWKTHPWGVSIGAIFGFTAGLAHLVHLANREDPPDAPPPEAR
jgi:F0F1-type ATP synthase assembly protein I